MTIKLAPGLVDAVVTYMTANLAATLTAEEAIWGDSIDIAMPNQIVKREPDHPQRINNPPFLYVVVARSQVYDWRSTYVMASHQLVTWLVAQDSDPEKLRKMIYRYGNALWKALVALDGAKTSGFEMAMPSGPIMPDIDYGETLTKGSMAMGDVRLVTWWTGRETA